MNIVKSKIAYLGAPEIGAMQVIFSLMDAALLIS
jgi:hypothetical protein